MAFIILPTSKTADSLFFWCPLPVKAQPAPLSSKDLEHLNDLRSHRRKYIEMLKEIAEIIAGRDELLDLKIHEVCAKDETNREKMSTYLRVTHEILRGVFPQLGK